LSPFLPARTQIATCRQRSANDVHSGGPVATLVTLCASGSRVRETLGPVRWPGTPSWAGSPGSREGSIDLTPCTGTQQFPPARGAERPIGGDFPHARRLEQETAQGSRGGPGDRGGMGAPTGHWFCAATVVGDWRKGTPGREPGSRGIPPAGHATAWPWGPRDGGEEVWGDETAGSRKFRPDASLDPCNGLSYIGGDASRDFQISVESGMKRVAVDASSPLACTRTSTGICKNT